MWWLRRNDDPAAIDGLSDILNDYTVDEFWDNNVAPSSQNYSALLSLVQSKGITVKHPQAGDNLTVEGLRMDMLNPQKQRLLGNPESDAIVMKLSDKAFCALLLNPTIEEQENTLISSGTSLRCGVVTYFDHGEGGPSLLISSYAQPKDAIISVGENGANLPSPTTLSWLGLESIAVWRTDLNGTVAVTSDGLGNYTVGSYNEDNSTYYYSATR